MSALEQFPLLMAALKQELREELLEEFGLGQWIDQEHSVLGRNKHIRACRRLIKENRDCTDVHCQDGRWFLRASALDAEIARANRLMVESGKLDTEPPPAMTLVPPMPLAKTEPEPEDETGIYDRGIYTAWLEKMR